MTSGARADVVFNHRRNVLTLPLLSAGAAATDSGLIAAGTARSTSLAQRASGTITPSVLQRRKACSFLA